MKITVGPLFYPWARSQRRAFWARMAECEAVDRVCLGDPVCGKRDMPPGELEAIAGRFRRAGREVIWTTPLLPVDPGAEMPPGTEAVELNDVAFFSLLPAGRRAVAGSFLNATSPGTLRVFENEGVEGICFSPEMSGADQVALTRQTGLFTESVVFGRIPLSVSARCLAAHRHGRRRADCRQVCRESPDGTAIQARDGRNFLHSAGPVTLSGGCLALSPRDAAFPPVKGVRLFPEPCDMAVVATLYRRVLDGKITGAELVARLSEERGAAAPLINGYFYGQAGAAWCNLPGEEEAP